MQKIKLIWVRLHVDTSIDHGAHVVAQVSPVDHGHHPHARNRALRAWADGTVLVRLVVKGVGPKSGLPEGLGRPRAVVGQAELFGKLEAVIS